jgi:hypothetical protein
MAEGEELGSNLLHSARMRWLSRFYAFRATGSQLGVLPARGGQSSGWLR